MLRIGLVLLCMVLLSASAAAAQIAPPLDPLPITRVLDDAGTRHLPAPPVNGLIPPPEPFPTWLTGTHGRTLIVDLSDFRIYAYEDGALVRSSLIATGRFNMATETGTFSVIRKAELSDLTFRGETVEAVPWILVYTDVFAIHGAYWHNAFGTRASSGCVNLPVDEAEWYYHFADIGTPVIVQA